MNIKRSVTAVALAALAAFTLTGCGTPNPHEPTELHKINELVKLDKVWSVNVGEGLTGLLTPAVVNGDVFAAGESAVYRLDPKTGKQLWRVRTDAPITAGVGSDGQLVAVGTAAGEMEVYDRDGKRLWKVKLSSEMNVPPLVGSGFVIARTADTRVTAFDAVTGERRWRYQDQVPALTVRAASQMKFAPAGILIGQSNGRLLALDGTGKTVFSAVIAQPKGITEVERLVDVVGAPLVDSRMMCAAAFQGNVLCLNVQNGRLLWQAPIDAVTGPVSDGTHVYVVNAQGEIQAYDYTEGTVQWTNKDLRWRTPSAPVAMGKVIALGDYDGEIHVLDPQSGQIVGRSSVSGAVRVPPVMMQDGALFQTSEGQLTYIRLRQ